MSVPQYFLDDPYLTPKEVMKITGMNKSTVYNKIHEEIGYYQFSTRNIYIKCSDLQKWMESKRRMGQSD